MDDLIHRYKKNLNIILTNLENPIIKNDIIHHGDNILYNIIENKLTISELIALCEEDENIIQFNLLENIYKICPYDKIAYIYKKYVISDILDTFRIVNHLWEFKYYSIASAIYSFNIYSNRSKIDIKYNSYISKSILHTHSNRIYIKYMNNNYISIYLYLYMINVMKDSSYKKYIVNIPEGKKKLLEKSYFYFYK